MKKTFHTYTLTTGNEAAKHNKLMRVLLSFQNTEYMLGFGYLPPRQMNISPRKLNDVTFGEVKWLPEAYRRWGQAIILLTYLHLRKS